MNKSKEQYEGWFKKEFDEEMAKYGEKLVDFVKKEQFKIWQASRECLEVELPYLDAYADDYLDGFNDAISEVEKRLTSAGVKIK